MIYFQIYYSNSNCFFSCFFPLFLAGAKLKALVREGNLVILFREIVSDLPTEPRERVYSRLRAPSVSPSLKQASTALSPPSSILFLIPMYHTLNSTVNPSLHPSLNPTLIILWKYEMNPSTQTHCRRPMQLLQSFLRYSVSRTPYPVLDSNLDPALQNGQLSTTLIWSSHLNPLLSLLDRI